MPHLDVTLPREQQDQQGVDHEISIPNPPNSEECRLRQITCGACEIKNEAGKLPLRLFQISK